MAQIIEFLRRPKGLSRFERLMLPHLDHLYRVAYRFTGSREDAEDLVQDLMVKLYPQRRRLASMDRLRPWLARVLYNLFIDQTRRRARRPEGSDDELDTLSAPEACPATAFETTRLQHRLAAAMDELNPDQRALIALHDVEGYTLNELERVLDTPVGTLKSRLHRARANLRRSLDAEPFDATERVREQEATS